MSKYSREIIIALPLSLTLTWKKDVLVSTRLSWADRNCFADKPADYTPMGRKIAGEMKKYVAGRKSTFSLPTLAWDMLPEFSRKTLSELSRVPYGSTLTYGELAEMVGRPRAARAIGRVMANNPWPLLIPCHRVLGKNRKLTGFGPGLDMKQYLLELEAS